MKFTTALALLLVLVLPFAASAEEKKAKTVDELAAMFDVSSCKGCHPKQFEEWEESYHAISLVGSPRTMATIKTAITDGMMKEWAKSGVKEVKDIKVEHMTTCFKCHLPQIKYATDDVARELAQAVLDGKREILEKVNINCLICHNMKAITHKWVDGEPEANAVYGTKEGAHGDSKYTVLKKSPIMQESIICGQCHGLGPNFELAEPTQCATLYGSYLHAYVPSGGSETCQDCHMKKGKTGHLMPAYRDPNVAKQAVDVDIKTMSYQFLPKAGDHVPTAVVTLAITNNAGHRIPDG